ncbi:trypsin-like isoform 2-T2 [Discoglossus pictus]
MYLACCGPWSHVWAENTGRIIGGSECIPHSKPWQVALYNYDQFICGGVLIHENWVLTAAHCYSSNIQIRLGAHSRTSSDGVQFNFAEKICHHCEFDYRTYDNDIMLLKLATPAIFNEYVQLILLPSVLVAEGTSCSISGWGSTTSPTETYPDVLQCANVTIVSQSCCQEKNPDELITDNMLCAGVREGGIDTCQGDSGGPLECDSVLQGITSWGDIPCAQPCKPAIYTKVINYIDWINNIILNEEEACTCQLK